MMHQHVSLFCGDDKQVSTIYIDPTKLDRWPMLGHGEASRIKRCLALALTQQRSHMLPANGSAQVSHRTGGRRWRACRRRGRRGRSSHSRRRGLRAHLPAGSAGGRGAAARARRDALAALARLHPHRRLRHERRRVQALGRRRCARLQRTETRGGGGEEGGGEGSGTAAGTCGTSQTVDCAIDPFASLVGAEPRVIRQDVSLKLCAGWKRLLKHAVASPVTGPLRRLICAPDRASYGTLRSARQPRS